MKVAILEYICCSGVFRDYIPQGTNTPLSALLGEGYAMLSALTNDIIDSGVDVYSPIEPTIAAWPRWRKWTESQWTWSPISYDPHRSIDDVATRWIESIVGCDAAIVIAPELDGILPHIIARLREAGVSVLASDEFFLSTACDQWKTCESWRLSGIRHPKTYLLEEFLRSPPDASESEGWVVKRRDSAGCVGLQRFVNLGLLLSEVARQVDFRASIDRWVVQPWVPGIAASLALLCGEENRILGAVEQRIEPLDEENPSEWGYCGGAGPVPGVNSQDLDHFARGVLRAIPGKPQGWIGIDFVIEPDGQWCAVEINPRMTTSYLGYRQWYGPRLAGCWARRTDIDEVDSPRIDFEEFPRVCFSVESFEG